MAAPHASSTDLTFAFLPASAAAASLLRRGDTLAIERLLAALDKRERGPGLGPGPHFASPDVLRVEEVLVEQVLVEQVLVEQVPFDLVSAFVLGLVGAILEVALDVELLALQQLIRQVERLVRHVSSLRGSIAPNLALCWSRRRLDGKPSAHDARATRTSSKYSPARRPVRRLTCRRRRASRWSPARSRISG